jgi:hypothetical protein
MATATCSNAPLLASLPWGAVQEADAIEAETAPRVRGETHPVRKNRDGAMQGRFGFWSTGSTSGAVAS